MKKILTLLIAIGAVATMHAQSREETRKVILGGSKDRRTNDRDVVLGRGDDNNGQYPGTYGGDRQSQVDQINREYDNKIYSIRNNPNLSNQEKQRIIRELERDRQRRISQVNGDDNRRNRRYENDDRYERKGDNGKHKGWYKKNKNKNGKKGKKDRDWDDD